MRSVFSDQPRATDVDSVPNVALCDVSAFLLTRSICLCMCTGFSVGNEVGGEPPPSCWW